MRRRGKLSVIDKTLVICFGSESVALHSLVFRAKCALMHSVQVLMRRFLRFHIEINVGEVLSARPISMHVDFELAHTCEVLLLLSHVPWNYFL